VLKPAGIYQLIGRRPIQAFGNSDSDMQMNEYTMGGEGRRLGLFIHHTDANPSTRRMANGWSIGDMKKDWKEVFPAR